MAAQQYLFTMEQLVAQCGEPIMTVQLDKPLPAFTLQRYHNKFIKAIGLRCNQFIGKTPKLPSTDDMASIGFRMGQDRIMKVCFRMRDLYCMGILNGDGVFFEVTKTSETHRLVQNSVVLGKGDGYGDLLRIGPDSPPLTLSKQLLVNGYYSFMALGTEGENRDAALFGIGVVCVLFMEACRQAEVQKWLVGEPGKNERYEDYAVYQHGGTIIDTAIHNWGDNSLTAEGLKRVQGEIVRIEDGSKVREILNMRKEVLIIKSNNYKDKIPGKESKSRPR